MNLAHFVVSLHGAKRRNRVKRQQNLEEYKRTGLDPTRRKKKRKDKR